MERNQFAYQRCESGNCAIEKIRNKRRDGAGQTGLLLKLKKVRVKSVNIVESRDLRSFAISPDEVARKMIKVS